MKKIYDEASANKDDQWLLPLIIRTWARRSIDELKRVKGNKDLLVSVAPKLSPSIEVWDLFRELILFAVMEEKAKDAVSPPLGDGVLLLHGTRSSSKPADKTPQGDSIPDIAPSASSAHCVG